MDTKDLIEAHKYSSDNKKYLSEDTKCGCFYCCKIYDPKEIDTYLNEKSGTALCPYCQIDSVIPEEAGYTISKEFLEEMHNYWFISKRHSKSWVWFIRKKKRDTNSKDILKIVARIPNRGNFNVYQYFYAFMLELKDKGISLVDVGGENIFESNWMMMRSKYKKLILKIHNLLLNDINEFSLLHSELGGLIDSPEFMKWVTVPWFRFFTIKSLHDSNLTKIQFDQSNQELICNVETKNAIDFIPFDNQIEIRIQTIGLSKKNLGDITRCVEDNDSIIFNIVQHPESESVKIELDYDCFIKSNEEYELPSLVFSCVDVQIRNM